MKPTVLVALLLLAGPALAQSRPSDAQLREQFRADFLRGCQSGRTPGVRNQRNYCSCYANSYLARYNGQTLAAISAQANQLGAGGPALVDLMMAPERQACAARS
ncbi:hypothetical protein [Cyanobium sp. PCC 7001]|uniref:hypothetical protein n=1 Tax=Cyanobium sp. PCC 7001 TaxID=180281 RepID=UPI0005BAEEB6|nr:hypothetical protein [Cyanobium sp. PCC 7001]